MSAVKDSLIAVGNRVIEEAVHDDNSDMVKLLVVVCVVFIGFVGWLVMILIKNGLNQRQISADTNSKVNDISNNGICTFTPPEGITNALTEIKSSIDEFGLWIQKKDSEDVSKKRRRYIMRSKVMDVLPMFYDVDVRRFAVAKATMFIDFVMENLELLKQDGGYDLFQQIFINKADESLSVGSDIIGEDRAKKFYEDTHNASVLEYLVNVEKINVDETNDKVNRFFNLSILFMQEFMSQLNRVQDQSKKRDNHVNSDTGALAKDFKMLEKAYLNIKESFGEHNER